MSTREVPGAAFVAPSRAHDGSTMPNYPTTITSDAGPRGRGTYVHMCHAPIWCAHAGGIGDGCGGPTTFTPTPTEPNTYSGQARDISGVHLWRIDRPELTPTMYTTGTWAYLARLGLDMRAARPLMASE